MVSLAVWLQPHRQTNHVGAVLMQILILFLKQFSCASVGKKSFDNNKMHGTKVKNRL